MIEKQHFGRTGHLSTRVIFGAAALSRVTQSEADRTLDLLQEYGINHIDTAASYGDAELRIGPWMQRCRKSFFLASKTQKRGYQEARDELHRSLDRLRVDQLDLWQLHNLVDAQEWESAMSPAGALEAAIEAREQARIRFIGVTGHGTTVAAMHRHSLDRFDFDAVLLPYNFLMMQNAQYAAEFRALMAQCQKQNVAVQTIKSLARRPWGDRPQTRTTWYEPFEDQADIDRAVNWVLSRPKIFLNTAADIHLLPKVLNSASRLQSAPSQSDMEQIAAELEMEPLFV